MKQHGINKFKIVSSWIKWTTATLIFPSIVFATQMTTSDSDYSSLDIDKLDVDTLLEESQDQLLLANLKKNLKLGNLDAVGQLSSMLIKMGKSTPDILASQGIFLASKGKKKEAYDILSKIKNEPLPPYALYAHAMLLKLTKSYDKAVEICDKAILLDPSHPFPWNIKGRTYFETGEYPSAIKCFKEAVSIEPKFLPALTNLGAAFYVTENYSKASQYFNQAKTLNPQSAQALYGLGVSLSRLGLNDQALIELENAVEIQPNHELALVELAGLYLKQKSYRKAFKTGETLKKTGNTDAHRILIEASLHLGNLKEAKTYLDEAPEELISAKYLYGVYFMLNHENSRAITSMQSVIEQSPDHYGAYLAQIVIRLYLGQSIDLENDFRLNWGDQLNKSVFFIRTCTRIAQKDYSKAYSDLLTSSGIIQGISFEGISEKEFETNISNRESRHLCMGMYLFLNNYLDAALDEFDQALRLNLNSGLASFWSGQAALAQGERKAALDFLKKAIQVWPRFFSALYAAGELEIMSGNIKAAVEYYKRAAVVKKDPGVLVKLGLINERFQNFKSAEEHYQDLIDHHPALFIGYSQLAWLYSRRGVKLDKALDLAKKADELQPGNSSIQDTLGWIYFQTKEYKTALKRLQEADKIGPDNPTILYHLAAIHHALKEDKLAIQYLEKALNLSKPFDEYNVAKNLMERLK